MDISHDGCKGSLLDPPERLGFVVRVLGLPRPFWTGRKQAKLLPQRLFFADEQDALC